MSKYYGKTNAIISNGGEQGGGELNFYYGLTPPSDVSKIWVRTDKKVSNIKITSNPTWSNEINATIIKNDLENISNSFLCRAGEYVYIFGGIKEGIGLNKIRRYNTITNEFETLNFKLPYGAVYCGAACKDDYIYITYASSFDGTDYYLHGKILIYDWRRNIIVDGKYLSDLYNFTRVVIVNNDVISLGGRRLTNTTTLNNYDKYLKYNSLNSYYSDYPKIYNIKSKEIFTSNTLGYHKNMGVGQRIDKKFTLVGTQGDSGIGVGKYVSFYINYDINHNNNITNFVASSIEKNSADNIALFIENKIYICGGKIEDNVNTTTSIMCFDIGTSLWTTETTEMPLSMLWQDCQFDCQSSYGVNGQYLVKVEKPLSLQNNEMLIIPNIMDDKFNLETSIENAYIGNNNGKAEMVRLYKYNGSNWIGINCDNYNAPIKNISTTDVWEETTSTSLTANIVCNVGDLIVASVVARDSGNETVSEGWELLGRSQVGQSNQTLAFYKKIATREDESITITQSSSARIYISMVSFAGNMDATLGDVQTKQDANQWTISLPDNKVCLVSSSSVFWVGNNPMIYVNPNDANYKDFSKVETLTSQERLGTWIDYNGGGNRTCIAGGSDPGGNSFGIGYVIIE